MHFLDRGSATVLLLISLSTLLGSNYASLPTYEEYVVYEELENQLLSKEDSAFNVYQLAEVFYPKVGPSPICAPFTYTLVCPNASVISNCTEDLIPCADSEAGSFNATYLWSHYDLSTPIGPVLLSYACNGITLKGFDWQDSCSFRNGLHFVLNIDNITCRSGDVIRDALKALTAVAKTYARSYGKGGSIADSETKGYALRWNHRDREDNTLDASHYTLIFMTVVLNVFVFLISVAMTTFTYDAIYRSIKEKRNPNYPLFWSFVVLSFVWNVGPSWLVLSGRSAKMLYTPLALMVLLECIVAILIKKKSDFPVPILSTRGCPRHKDCFSSSDILRCIYCLISYSAQTFAIWNILVFLTFVAYYVAAIIVAFYLYPTEVLVRVVFLKAMAVCAVLNVALLFSNSKFKCGCTWKSFQHDLGYMVRVVAIAMFLPILGFFAFVVGGIIFTGSQQTSGLQTVLTLLPSVFLVFAAWFTKGTLFPAGSNEADLGSQIVNELETGGGSGGGGTHSVTKSATTKMSASPPHAGSSSFYNSLNSHSRAPDSGRGSGGGGPTTEHTPLL